MGSGTKRHKEFVRKAECFEVNQSRKRETIVINMSCECR